MKTRGIDDLYPADIMHLSMYSQDYNASCPPSSIQKRNDYVEFLLKCANHAEKVGDYGISERLFDEAYSWKEVDDSQYWVDEAEHFTTDAFLRAEWNPRTWSIDHEEA